MAKIICATNFGLHGLGADKHEVEGPLLPDFDGWERNDGGGWKEVSRPPRCIVHVGDYGLFVAMRDKMPHADEARKEWLRRYPKPIGGTGWKGWAKWSSNLVQNEEKEGS